MSKKTLQVGSRTISLSNAEKVLFPEDGFTKEDIAEYYRRIAEVMIPHMKGRPLNMQRFPDGIGEGGFYEKKAPDHFPDWIERTSVYLKEEKGRQDQVVCNNGATLVYLADQACLTPHLWLSREDKLKHPDRLIFDLDPPGRDFDPVREAALSLRQLLEELGLLPFVMTTGSKGLHVLVPLDRRSDFDAARSFARDVARILEAKNPDGFTIETQKDKRKGRVFLDYLRNAYGQTAVAPYAIRPKPGAPIATPLEWDELSDRKLTPRRYTLQNIFRRLGQREDPWEDIQRRARSLKKPRQRLKQMAGDG
jgi:bifunctional non-homologous end joining protein LigD